MILLVNFVEDFINDFFNTFIKRIYACYFKYVLFLNEFKTNAHLFFIRNIDKNFFLKSLKNFSITN